MKWLVISIPYLFPVFSASGQSLNISDLIKLTTANYQQAKVYLLQEKHFTALPTINAEGTPIAQYDKNDINGITELVVKSEWRDKQAVHPFVHYDVRPKAYINKIISQLRSLSFLISSKESDKNKSVWLYDNGKFTVSIYTFTEKKLPASIEIHLK